MPQHITLAEVKKAGRDYYNRGKLTAQHPDPSNRRCEYRIGSYRCVIGSVLSIDTIDAIDDFGSTELGILHNDVSQFVTCDESERDQLSALQVAHDNWAQDAAAENEDEKRTKATFEDLLFAD